MIKEQSTAARAFRAVAVVVTLVTIVTFSTVAYSAYQDVEGVIGATTGTGGGGVGTSQATVSGGQETVALNFTVPNGGLYPLHLTIDCAAPAGVPVSCRGIDVTVQPGRSQKVTLLVTVTNVTQFRGLLASGSALHLPANMSATLEPFATLDVTFDLGSLLTGGGR